MLLKIKEIEAEKQKLTSRKRFFFSFFLPLLTFVFRPFYFYYKLNALTHGSDLPALATVKVVFRLLTHDLTHFSSSLYYSQPHFDEAYSINPQQHELSQT